MRVIGKWRFESTINRLVVESGNGRRRLGQQTDGRTDGQLLFLARLNSHDFRDLLAKSLTVSESSSKFLGGVARCVFCEK